MAGFPRLRHRKTCLDLLDLEGLILLCENGYSFAEAMNLLESVRNRPVFAEIRNHLENGENLSEFISMFMPGQIRTAFSSFIQYLSFEQSAALSFSFEKQRRQSETEFIRLTFYPCFLLIGSSAGVILFQRFCLPMMQQMLSLFSDIDASMSFAGFLSTFVLILIILAVILTVGFLVISRNEKLYLKLYVLLEKYMPNNLLSQRYTADFARYFKECHRIGLATRQSLTILRLLPHQPVIRFLCGRLEESLESGTTFVNAAQDAGLDQQLIRFIRIAIYSSNIENMLSSYIELTEKKLKRQLQRIGKGIQLSAYLTIGALVLMIYQILLIPLQMLSQM